MLDIAPLTAAGISFGSLLAAWLAYEALCRSPLGRHELALALIGYVFLVALTYAFTHMFSGRGAFNQIGALIGTIMVANVFVIIIPEPAEDRRGSGRRQRSRIRHWARPASNVRFTTTI